MMSINNQGWIGDKYYNSIGYLRAKDCKNDKDNFLEELKKRANG